MDLKFSQIDGKALSSGTQSPKKDNSKMFLVMGIVIVIVFLGLGLAVIYWCFCAKSKVNKQNDKPMQKNQSITGKMGDLDSTLDLNIKVSEIKEDSGNDNGAGLKPQDLKERERIIKENSKKEGKDPKQDLKPKPTPKPKDKDKKLPKK